MEKKLLQISNDFADQKIYINLVRKLSDNGYSQIVYVPLKWRNKINGNRDDSIKRVEFYYSYILKRNLLFKLQYYKKIKIILNDLEDKINLNEVGLIHAHFLFSDGGVAYLLKKKYNIPYIVSVRASDIHTFFAKMIHLRKFGNEIMKEAEKVIFVNFSYKEIFKKKYLEKNHNDILNKTQIIPNAINDRWFKNKPEKKSIQNQIRLLYVGRLVKRKKLDVVIKALKLLNSKSNNRFVLDVVGEGEFREKFEKLADPQVVFYGQITNFKELLLMYNNSHIFVMPSIKETFGLVYIEALSQGLPIIYCKHEAVDGYFGNKQVGVAVRPNNHNDVVKAVSYIVDNYNQLSLEALKTSNKFNWNDITNSFMEIYDESLC